MFGTGQPAGSSGFTFGAPATTTGLQTQPTFGFGAAASTNTAPALGFGAAATTTSAPTFGFGTSTFGASTSTATSRPTGFATLFGGGTTSTAAGGTGSGLFAGLGGTSTVASTQPSLFGGSTGGAFGATGLFGQSQPAASTSLFGGLGASQQQQLQQTQQQTYQQQLKTALVNPQIFNDERDVLIAKWNQLQAAFGRGKAYYASNMPALDLTTANPYCRFRTVAYNRLPETENSEGLVTFVFDKKYSDVVNIQSQLPDRLVQLLGSKPNITFQAHIVSIKAVGENKCEMLLYITERLQSTGQTRHIPASDLSHFLNQTTYKSQLSTAGISTIYPRVTLTKEQIHRYLAMPPPGIDSLLWEQAKKNNPNASKLLPVPVVGFDQLHQRVMAQVQENQAHQQEIQKLEEGVKTVTKKHIEIEGKVEEYKKQLGALSHRILRVMCKMQCNRQRGQPLTDLDDEMMNKLQEIYTYMNVNPNCRGRVKELLSEVRQRPEEYGGSSSSTNVTYSLDEESEQVVTKHLADNQTIIKDLSDIVSDDLKDIHLLGVALDTEK